jgi:hypothetical protein
LIEKGSSDVIPVVCNGFELWRIFRRLARHLRTSLNSQGFRVGCRSEMTFTEERLLRIPWSSS